MATETLSCPYCNSSVTIVRAAGRGQRLRCPRCHELFPYRGGEGQDYGQRGDSGPREPVYGEDDENPYPRRWSNRSVALIILSVMGTMAALGFALAWFTTENRRLRDR